MEWRISVQESYELFVQALQDCGLYLLEEDDDTIGYLIFEEFSVDAGSFLHSITLQRLIDAGMISNEIAKKSAELRRKFMVLDEGEWGIQSIKTAPEWREIMELSDEIKRTLNVDMKRQL